ncbi:hypothetical protein AOLI_G00144980 [Acnodon oligacanthus]
MLNWTSGKTLWLRFSRIFVHVLESLSNLTTDDTKERVCRRSTDRITTTHTNTLAAGISEKKRRQHR